MTHRRPSTVCLLAMAATMVFAAEVSAGEVYQWKDANGVTHYSQTPPAGGAARYRVITHRESAAQAQADAPKAEDPQCGVARANVALIESGRPLRRDTNGDGVPDRDLSAAERSSQLQLAQTVLRANCTPPAQAAASQATASAEAASEEPNASESEK
jgi:Domain of unknown function (DUF4124)